MRRLLVVLLVVAGCGGSGGAPVATSTTIDSATSDEVLTVAVRTAATKLPLVDITTSSATDDPNGLLGQPGQYVARVAWRDQRLRPTPVKGELAGVETGGSMERFAAATDLTERKQSLEATLGLLINSEALIVHGLVLVRLPSALSKDQAAEVDAALAAVLPAPPPTTAVQATGSSRTTRPPRPPTTRA